MTKEHPNITLLPRIDILDLNASSHLFADAFVWHYFNPNYPDVQGDSIGIEGLKNIFKTLAVKISGIFKVKVVTFLHAGR